MQITFFDPETGENLTIERTRELGDELVRFHDGACKHSEFIACKAITSDGRTQIRNQCLRCGEYQGSAIKQSAGSEKLPTADSELAINYQRQREEERTAILQKHAKLQAGKIVHGGRDITSTSCRP